MHERVVTVMTEFLRRIGRSGAYALLAMGFVLGCSLLVGAEGTKTSVARLSDPTELPLLSGSTEPHLPEAEPSAGR